MPEGSQRLFKTGLGQCQELGCQDHPAECDVGQGVSLTVAIGSTLILKAATSCGDPGDPGQKDGEQMDQQEHGDPCCAAGLTVLVAKAKLMRLERTKALLNAHAGPVNVDDIQRGPKGEFFPDSALRQPH